MQVEGQHESSLLDLMATGARVRNTYPIYLSHGDSLSKERLIPDVVTLGHLLVIKDLSDMDVGASD